jgi:hypothetical protein
MDPQGFGCVLALSPCVDMCVDFVCEISVQVCAEHSLTALHVSPRVGTRCLPAFTCHKKSLCCCIYTLCVSVSGVC